MAGLNS